MNLRKARLSPGKVAVATTIPSKRRGFIIYGDGGSLVNLGFGDYEDSDAYNKLVKEAGVPMWLSMQSIRWAGSGNLDLYHFDNFIKAVRGESTLNSPVDEAYKSVLLRYLANIAQRTSGTLLLRPIHRSRSDNPAATALCNANMRKAGRRCSNT